MAYPAMAGIGWRPRSHAFTVSRSLSNTRASASWVSPSWSRMLRNSRRVKRMKASGRSGAGQAADGSSERKGHDG